MYQATDSDGRVTALETLPDLEAIHFASLVEQLAHQTTGRSAILKKANATNVVVKAGAVPANPVIYFTAPCSIFTTASEGGATSKSGSTSSKAWVPTSLTLHNHAITLTDKSGTAKQAMRVYSMAKGGSCESVEYEGKIALLLKCVDSNKAKYLHFKDPATAAQVATALSLYFTVSPQTMAYHQAQILLTAPISHLASLDTHPHPCDLPPVDLYKSAKMCHATGAKFGVFGGSSRCDNCGNGFTSSHLTPCNLPHLPPAATAPTATPPITLACVACATSLKARVAAATAMEDALAAGDLDNVISLLSSQLTSAIKLPHDNSPPPHPDYPAPTTPLLSPDYATVTGLTPLLVAVTTPDPQHAIPALETLLKLSIDVNARSVVTKVRSSNEPSSTTSSKSGLSPTRRKSSASMVPSKTSTRVRMLSAVTVRDRLITGVTPLMAATMLDRRDVMQVLLEHGADPTITGDARDSYSPLCFAVRSGTLEALNLLVNATLSPPTEGETTRFVPDIDFRDENAGNSALHVAARFNNVDAAKLLLTGNARPSVTNNKLETALHVAAANGFATMCGILAKADGESVNGRDREGNTPVLCCARRAGEGVAEAEKLTKEAAAETILILGSHSANMITSNFDGESPQSVCELPAVDALGHAIHAGRWDEVLRLIDNGNFPINYLSGASDYLTALAGAAKSGDNVTENRYVRELIRRKGNPLTIIGEGFDENALHIAAAHGQPKTLELLLNSGWGFNETHIDESQTIMANGKSPLHRAVLAAAGYNPEVCIEESVVINRSQEETEKSLQCIRFLLDNDFNPLLFDDNNETPFFLAVKSGDAESTSIFAEKSRRAEDEETVSLFSLDAPHTNGQTALMKAASMGKIPIVDILLTNDASLAAVDINGKNALHYAALSGETQALKHLISKADSALVRAVDSFGFTLLHTAAKFLHINPANASDASLMFSIIVAAGVDFTAVEFTKNYKAIDIVNLLPPSMPTPDRIIGLLHAMDEAMHSKNYDTILLYIKRGNCPVDYVCGTEGAAFGVTGLVVACSDSSEKGCAAARELIKRGSDINFTSNGLVAPFFGASPAPITPLLSAVMCGNVMGAEILLENGANIGGVPVSGEGGSFILLAAAQARREQLVQLLIEAGVDVNTTVNGMSPLFVASSCGDLKIVDLLVDSGADLNARHTAVSCVRASEMRADEAKEGDTFYTDNTTPLMMASLRANVDVVTRLVEKVDVKKKDLKGRTALFYAARSGNFEVVTLLIGKSGIDVNEEDISGRTALMDACKSGMVGAVHVLLEAGSDPSSETGGLTPLTEAIAANNTDVIAAIDAALSKDDTAIVKGELGLFISRVKARAAPVDYEARIDVLGDKKGFKKRADSMLSIGAATGPTVTALIKACELKDGDSVKELIALKADVNKCCDRVVMDAPVLVCARGNDVAVMKALLSANLREEARQSHKMRVNANVSDKRGETALSIAVSNDNGEMVRVLLENGSDPLAACSTHEMDWGDSIEGEEKTSAFFLACAGGKMEAVKECVKCMSKNKGNRRYDVNHKQSGNEVTALMCAAYGGHLKAVKELCEVGKCDVGIVDKFGRTAAHFASMQGWWEIVVELCGKNGASCGVNDKEGRNVVAVAKNGETKAAATMCFEGEGAYKELVRAVEEEDNRRLGEMEKRLNTALEGLAEAQAIVAGVEEEERNGDSVPVSLTFSRLAEMLCGEAGLKEAGVGNLKTIRGKLRECLDSCDREVIRRLEEDEKMLLCLVCKERQRDCVLMPCRHMACCGVCSQHPRFRSCPLCLSRVENVASDITLRAPQASAVGLEREGSVRLDGEGGFVQGGGEDGGEVVYAPVVVLRESGDISSALQRDDSSRSMIGDVVAARMEGGEDEDGVITAQVEVAPARV